MSALINTFVSALCCLLYRDVTNSFAESAAITSIIKGKKDNIFLTLPRIRNTESKRNRHVTVNTHSRPIKKVKDIG